MLNLRKIGLGGIGMSEDMMMIGEMITRDRKGRIEEEIR